MIGAADARRLSAQERAAIANDFIETHPEVMERLDRLVRTHAKAYRAYYPNDGAESVDNVPLCIALMSLGYGVRAANPAVARSGISISWCREYHTDRDGFQWDPGSAEADADDAE